VELKNRYGQQPVKTLTVDQLGAGLARVPYTFSSAELTQTSEPWVCERGGWREDDCQLVWPRSGIGAATLGTPATT
jgi:hypothetical protein